jgi:HK97 family phage prohead protease
MSEMSQSDTRTNEQNVAACLSAWRDKDKSARDLKLKQQMDDCPDVEDDEAYDDYMDRCKDELGDDGEDACQMKWEDRKAPKIVHKEHDNSDGSGTEYILSDATPDRYGDIVATTGWDFKNFEKNPIALFNHNPDFVIGTWSKLRADSMALRGNLKLAPKGTSPRIDEIRALIDAGILRAVSVGFKPIEHKPRDEKKGGYHYLKCELVETSLVSIPANPNALAVAKSLKISPETQKMVFAEHGKKNTGTVSLPASRRSENAQTRSRANSTGEHAIPKRSVRGGSPMTLSKRIEDAERFVVQLQDQLAEHLETVTDAHPNEPPIMLTTPILTMPR